MVDSVLQFLCKNFALLVMVISLIVMGGLLLTGRKATVWVLLLGVFDGIAIVCGAIFVLVLWKVMIPLLGGLLAALIIYFIK